MNEVFENKTTAASWRHRNLHQRDFRPVANLPQNPRPSQVQSSTRPISLLDAVWKRTAPFVLLAICGMTSLAFAQTPSFTPTATLQYDIGSPTAEEQYFLELMNRARANPAAEGNLIASSTNADIRNGINIFGVNLNIFKSEMAVLTVRPPLSMNSLLSTAARGHSADMLANNFQDHNGSNASTTGSRIVAAGYTWASYGENVYAYASSVFLGHAAFEIDWGQNPPSGMQPGRGHRMAIHGDFREVGMGVSLGRNGNVGPVLITQDFANPRDNTSAFVTGVAYVDYNTNFAYDPGEGLSGVRVDVEGADKYAITTASGGYSVPVPVSAVPVNHEVWFQGPDISTIVTVSVGGDNVKADLRINPPPSLIKSARLKGNLSFGKRKSGTRTKRVVTLTNTGASAIQISGIRYPQGFSGAWSGALQPGVTKKITVTFRPTAKKIYKGQMRVNANTTAAISPLTVSGTGQ